MKIFELKKIYALWVLIGVRLFLILLYTLTIYLELKSSVLYYFLFYFLDGLFLLLFYAYLFFAKFKRFATYLAFYLITQVTSISLVLTYYMIFFRREDFFHVNILYYFGIVLMQIGINFYPIYLLKKKYQLIPRNFDDPKKNPEIME